MLGRILAVSSPADLAAETLSRTGVSAIWNYGIMKCVMSNVNMQMGDYDKGISGKYYIFLWNRDFD